MEKNDDCFRCKCCGELPEHGMDDKLIEVLNMIGCGASDINSAYRCPAHNEEVGGTRNSFHVHGMAADVDATRFSGVEALASLAEQAGATGIGKYPNANFVHIDTRNEDDWARWTEW